MMDLKIFTGKRVLMLVGPESPFFYKLSKDIAKYAEKVYKVNLSGGCWLFYPFSAINYRGKPSNFGQFIEEFVQKEKIDDLIMFNDGKLAHRIVKNRLGSKVRYFVLEKGYIRPDFLTFEEQGVNGNSSLIGNIKVEELVNYKTKSFRIKSVGKEFLYLLIYSIFFYLAFILLKPFFPGSSLVYRNIHKLALGRAISFILQIYYRIFQKGRIENIINKLKGKYYFVPLQVHNDVQIRLHSNYSDIEIFIEEVIQSFSKNAPKDTYLLIKHHPIDLGYRNYTKLIENLSSKYGIKDRVFYLKTGDIPHILKNCIGVVTINSTVGMTALMHLKPLKVMGKAVYNVKGLTCDSSLDDFWTWALNFKPDGLMVEKFVNYLMEKSLINGSLYKRITNINHAGVFYTYYDDSNS